MSYNCIPHLQEFLDTVIQFATKNEDSSDKLRIIFDMCVDETKLRGLGSEETVEKAHLVELLSSVINIGKVKDINPEDIHLMIENMFKEAGLKNKKVHGDPN